MWLIENDTSRTFDGLVKESSVECVILLWLCLLLNNLENIFASRLPGLCKQHHGNARNLCHVSRNSDNIMYNFFLCYCREKV